MPLRTVSGATGKGIDTLLKVAFETREAWSRRIGTGELNRWFERAVDANPPPAPGGKRSEEHTSELQSLMRNSYAVFCLKKKKTKTNHVTHNNNYHPSNTHTRHHTYRPTNNHN